VNRAPHLLGYLYDLTDEARTRGKRRDRLHLLAQRVGLRRVIDLVREEPWDVVVNTHFLPADLIATMQRRRKPAPRQVTVVTDFDAHAMWVNEPCGRYFVATEEAALSLVHWGVDRARITVTGIPIHPVFAERKSQEHCRAKHAIDSDRPVVLLLAGGFGVGPIGRMFEEILKVERPLCVVAVAGKNESLRTKLGKVRVPERHRATVIGFTTEIDELMRAADVVMTKPGGLTTSEVLACGAAMVIVNPIPGQESRNSDYLLEHGAAIKVNSLASLAFKLGTILGDAGRLGRIRERARKLGRPDAAARIAREVLSGPD